MEAPPYQSANILNVNHQHYTIARSMGNLGKPCQVAFEISSKKVLPPTDRREAVGVMRGAHGLRERRASLLIGLARTSCRYRKQRGDEAKLRERLRELAQARRRFGYRRLTVLLKREGWRVNHKRVYRVYRAEGLLVRRRKRQRVGAGERPALVMPSGPNQRWSMDFISDALNTGRKFRSLNPSADGWTTTIGNAWRQKWTRR